MEVQQHGNYFEDLKIKELTGYGKEEYDSFKSNGYTSSMDLVEGLYVDIGVTFGDLKGTLEHFAKQLFGKNVNTRFRPSYFPFTEPSAEMDVSCIFCKSDGCNICKYSGWIEILGCGMVDPEVFKFVDYDVDLWSGFAFGVGIERIAMLKYGVKDIRMFYNGDIQFLKQFKL